jgi:hypothetical protein
MERQRLAFRHFFPESRICDVGELRPADDDPVSMAAQHSIKRGELKLIVTRELKAAAEKMIARPLLSIMSTVEDPRSRSSDAPPTGEKSHSRCQALVVSANGLKPLAGLAQR